MFERHAYPVKRVIYFANFEATHRGADGITPEDILLGLAWDADTRADRIAHLKDDAVQLRADVCIAHRPITALPYDQKKHLLLTKESIRIVNNALAEATADEEFYVDTDHLLRALLRENNVASAAVAKLGLTLDSLRSLSREDRIKNPSEQAPWFWKPPLLISKGEWGTAALLLVLAVLFAGGILWSWLH